MPTGHGWVEQVEREKSSFAIQNQRLYLVGESRQTVLVVRTELLEVPENTPLKRFVTSGRRFPSFGDHVVPGPMEAGLRGRE